MRFLNSREGVQANHLIRKIDAGAFVQIKLVDHRHDAVDSHLQTQPIKITIAGMRDRALNVGRAVISHAASKLVSHGNAAAANKIRMVEGDRTLLQSGDRHRNFPG